MDEPEQAVPGLDPNAPEVVTKLIECFQANDLEVLLRVFHYLEGKDVVHAGKFSQSWRDLEDALKNPGTEAFAALARKYADKTRQNQEFEDAMRQRHDNLAHAQPWPYVSEEVQRRWLQRFLDV